jgi:RNA polymerase sigma factor (sigma-70 family)
MSGMERAPAARSEATAPDARRDEGLVREALDGSTQAYDELYRRHRDGVARAVFLILADAHAAQDVAQEAFLVGWRDLRRLREASAFRAWISAIALNMCRKPSFLRRLPGRTPEVPEVPLVGGQEGAVLRLPVRQAVAELPHRMRAVVVLRFFAELSEREIAEALAIPVGTVKSRLQRARTRLAAALGPMVEEE